jgi:hypothetical protein
MSRARRRALVFAATAMILGALIATALLNRGPAPLPVRPPAQRPVLLLLTSLPLLFNEDFALSGGGSAAVERLTIDPSRTRMKARASPVSPMRMRCALLPA